MVSWSLANPSCLLFPGKNSNRTPSRGFSSSTGVGFTDENVCLESEDEIKPPDEDAARADDGVRVVGPICRVDDQGPLEIAETSIDVIHEYRDPKGETAMNEGRKILETMCVRLGDGLK